MAPGASVGGQETAFSSQDRDLGHIPPVAISVLCHIKIYQRQALQQHFIK